MQKVKAAVCREFGAPLVIEEVNLRDPGDGEVQVTLDACAICHSDISYADGGWGGQLPAVYGHEAAGRISAVGPGARNYTVGDHVIVTLLRACGDCGSCVSGEPAYCFSQDTSAGSPISSASGEDVGQAMFCGAFAEKVTVHASQLAKIPADMPKDAASLLSCGVITGLGAAVNTAAIRPGETVVVIGAGGVGLNAIQGARIAGAARIIAVDVNPEKLEMAREFGATDGVMANQEKPWKDAASKAGGRGADAVLVTVGAIGAYDISTRYLAPGGRMVMVGMNHSGEASSYDPSVIASLGQNMVGTKMGDTVLARDIPWMVDLYQQGRLKLEELVSGTWSLEQINEAIADTKSGAAKRNVIIFGD